MNSLKELFNSLRPTRHSYVGVPSDDDIVEAFHNDPDRSENRSRSSNPEVSTPIAILLVFLVSIFFAAAIGLPIYRASRPHVYDQCGTTPAEARARGCIFEITASSWVVPACYDEEVEAEFLASYDWHFYRDINYTQEVPLSEVRQGEDAGFFVTSQYHINHCAFLLKKMHRAVKRGAPVDGYIWPLHHTDHCIKWLTDPTGQYNYEWPQFAYRKYPYCGKDGGFSVDKKRTGEWV